MPLQSDALISEGKVDFKSLRSQLATVTASTTAYVLTSASEYLTQITGNGAGVQPVTLPDATTLLPGWRYEVLNNSQDLILLQDASAAQLNYVGQNQFLVATLLTNANAAGTWLVGIRDFVSGGLNKVYGATIFEDFLGPVIGGAGVGNTFWLITQTNGTITTPGVLDLNHPGTVNLSTTNSGAFATLSQNAVILAAAQYTFECLFRINTLGTSTDNGVFQCGFGAGIAANADPTSGIYLEYSSVASTFFRLRVGNASTFTNTVTTVTATANTWYKFRFVVSPTANQVQLYLSAAGGGAVNLIGTVTTNIPTTATLYPFIQQRKSSAALISPVAKAVDIDYVMIDYNLSNFR